jgi:quinolinate synthase
MALKDQILQLKKEKNALILAHYYQEGDIQDVADVVGDSLELARKGAQASETTLVVCGVKFMAESAKILSKDKKILIPRIDAGCPMADMVDYDDLLHYKKLHPERYIVSYVNTTADVKTLTDVCVTSSNALHIMKQLDAEKFLFLPDKNLGSYIKAQLPNKDIDVWPGFCLTHHRLKPEVVISVKEMYPNALVLVHPECTSEIVQLADFVGSTKALLEFAHQSSGKQFIIATEEGIMHPLRKQNPDKEFILASSRLVCQNMKKTSLEDVYNCLLHEKTEILLDEETLWKAYLPLEKCFL